MILLIHRSKLIKQIRVPVFSQALSGPYVNKTQLKESIFFPCSGIVSIETHDFLKVLCWLNVRQAEGELLY